MKNIKYKILSMSLMGIVLGTSSILINPLKANALGSIGSILERQNSEFQKFNADWGGVSEELKGKINPPRMSFNSNDTVRQNWYSTSARGNNTLFYNTYGLPGKKITTYTPVAESSNSNYSKNSSHANTYENAKYWFDVEYRKDLLYDGKYSNFKTVAQIPGTYNYINPMTYNSSGKFKGVSGEWRYIGYSNYGDPMENPYFPIDVYNKYSYGNYPYDLAPWKNTKLIPGGGTSFDDTLHFDFNYKISAIGRLLQQEPTMKAQKDDRYYWADRLSLRNDPTKSSALFMGTLNGRYYNTIPLYAPDIATVNLRIVEMKITDSDGNIVGSFSRSSTDQSTIYNGQEKINGKLKKREQYKVTVKVKNMSDYDLTVNPKKVLIGIGRDGNAYSNEEGFTKNDKNIVVSSPGAFKAGETVEFSQHFEIDSSVKKYIRFTGLIDEIHKLNMENTDSADDWAKLSFEVEDNNNMKVDSVKLVDYNGNEVENPIPGERYKIRYYVSYQGTDIKEAIYKTEWDYWIDEKGEYHWYSYQVFDYWYYPKFELPFTSSISRQLPPISGYNETTTKTLYPRGGNQTVENGKTYVYTTENYVVYEAPAIKTTGTISSTLSSYGIDKDGRDNTITKEWKDDYDIRVENVKVHSNSERPVEKGNLYFGVSYDIVMDVPSYVKDYEKDVHVAITVGNKTITKKEHVKVGRNSNIVQEVETWVDPSKDKELSVQVNANADKMVYEKDISTQKNNVGKDKAYILSPINPYNGACSLNGQTTNNNWTKNYNRHYWGGTYTEYYNFAGSRPYSFNKYYSMGDDNDTVSQNESFKITKVLFRSKMTEDKKQGTNKDGWVELTSGVAGQIKAGYGYELKVEVNYNTNAFNSEPTAWNYGSHSEYGMWVRPTNVTPNIPSELFVKTPDGKILSVTGNNKTIKGLDVSKVGDRNSTTWTYTVKSKDTLGIKSTPKIYVDENTVDGVYDLQVFTPEINGVPTKTSGRTLCDVKNLKIEVKGSVTDDLNTHIVQ